VGRQSIGSRATARLPWWTDCASEHSRVNKWNQDLPMLACAVSFYAHVFFDKEYHVEGSRLQRFAWFRRKQELHFVHHRHANSNFAVIHFFWDRILGTYRRPDAG
jgi:sterol desaturase/sphingolipid hydroxylase (fatty acid hydroxylase superfamily)